MSTNNVSGELANLLNEYFSRTEVITLCFDLGVDHEELAGPDSPKSHLVRQLLTHLMQRGRLEELISIAEKQRPQVPWPFPKMDSVGNKEGSEGNSASYLHTDREIFLHVQQLLPSSRIVSFLRDFDFGNSFSLEMLEPLSEFHRECQLPEFGFLDDELEQLRLELAEAIERLLRSLGSHTFPLRGEPGYTRQEVPREWVYEQPERWAVATNELNQNASNAYTVYVKLIKTARRKLAI